MAHFLKKIHIFSIFRSVTSNIQNLFGLESCFLFISIANQNEGMNLITLPIYYVVVFVFLTGEGGKQLGRRNGK